MQRAIFALSAFLSLISPAVAQVGIGIELPGMSIGINLPVYPRLVLVPGYPVYYAPAVNLNYFWFIRLSCGSLEADTGRGHRSGSRWRS